MLRIEIINWSATNYSFLINNNLGWVSDDFCFYEFDNEENYQTMCAFLMGQNQDRMTLKEKKTVPDLSWVNAKTKKKCRS